MDVKTDPAVTCAMVGSNFNIIHLIIAQRNANSQIVGKVLVPVITLKKKKESLKPIFAVSFSSLSQKTE